MKQVKLGNGVRITESKDMGIFLHFESLSGHSEGWSLGNTNKTFGHRWASELLDSKLCEEVDSPEIHPIKPHKG